MTPAELKAYCEMVWNRRGIAHPGHKVGWTPQNGRSYLTPNEIEKATYLVGIATRKYPEASQALRRQQKARLRKDNEPKRLPRGKRVIRRART